METSSQRSSSLNCPIMKFDIHIKNKQKYLGQFFSWFFYSLKIMQPLHVLCIAGELAGGGSVDVTVGFSDMQQVTGDMQNMTFDT